MGSLEVLFSVKPELPKWVQLREVLATGDLSFCGGEEWDGRSSLKSHLHTAVRRPVQ